MASTIALARPFASEAIVADQLLKDLKAYGYRDTQWLIATKRRAFAYRRKKSRCIANQLFSILYATE